MMMHTESGNTDLLALGFVRRDWLVICILYLFLFIPFLSVGAQTEEEFDHRYVERPALPNPVWSDLDEEWQWDWETLDSILVSVKDTLYISRLEDITEYFGMSYDEYVHRFMMFKDEQDSARALSSELIYLNYFLPLLRSESDFMSKRLVSREYIINQDNEYTRLTLREYPINYYYTLNGLFLDVMLTCYGRNNTEIFLQSPYAMQTTIEQLFASIHFTRNRRIRGVNFYFPDYDFTQKREMAQLIKSVSLVTDSSRVKGIRGLNLYVTFDHKKGIEHEDFLCCLTQMADSVFLIDQQPELNVVPVIKVIDQSAADSLGIAAKIKNQLYLARYARGEFPITSEEFSLSDIRTIMYNDYDDNIWEPYFFALIIILLSIVAGVLLYRFSSVFSYYANKNMDYMYALLIMVILEIYLLTFTMLECMSKDNIFTFGGDNRGVILLMPVLFLFILPMMKSIRNRRHLP